MKELDLKKFHEESKLEGMKSIQGIQCLGSVENHARHIDEFQRDIDQLWQMRQLDNDRIKVTYTFCIFIILFCYSATLLFFFLFFFTQKII